MLHWKFDQTDSSPKVGVNCRPKLETRIIDVSVEKNWKLSIQHHNSTKTITPVQILVHSFFYGFSFWIPRINFASSFQYSWRLVSFVTRQTPSAAELGEFTALGALGSLGSLGSWWNQDLDSNQSFLGWSISANRLELPKLERRRPSFHGRLNCWLFLPPEVSKWLCCLALRAFTGRVSQEPLRLQAKMAQFFSSRVFDSNYKSDNPAPLISAMPGNTWHLETQGLEKALPRRGIMFWWESAIYSIIQLLEYLLFNILCFLGFFYSLVACNCKWCKPLCQLQRRLRSSQLWSNQELRATAAVR